MVCELCNMVDSHGRLCATQLRTSQQRIEAAASMGSLDWIASMAAWKRLRAAGLTDEEIDAGFDLYEQRLRQEAISARWQGDPKRTTG